MEALLPRVPSGLFRRVATPHLTLQSQFRTKPRVGLLTGCVQDVFFRHVNQATARVLAAEGCDVIIPQHQSCCGALHLHSGKDAEAAALARRTIATFEAANVEVIVINAAGCGSSMKDYAHLLRNDSAWAARAAAFSARCKDISEVLVDLQQQRQTAASQRRTASDGPADLPATHAPRHPLPMRAAYHDACHLRHAQAVYEQPRDLLAQIPQLEIAEIEEATLCCGSAGVYNLLYPDTADQLGDRKVTHLLATGAEAVISANPGCLLQLMSGLHRRGLAAMPTFHMVELLDASIRGLTPEALLRERGFSVHLPGRFD